MIVLHTSNTIVRKTWIFLYFRTELISKSASDNNDREIAGCCGKIQKDMAGIHGYLFFKQSIMALIAYVPSLVVCVLVIRDILPMNYETASPLNHDQAMFIIR